MLTKIVDTSEGYAIGDSYILDDESYIIDRVEISGTLSRIWLK